MAYIGKQPTVGNFVKLDAITATATTTFNLLNGGVAYYPQSANHCLVSLNGILQAPTDSFTISGSTIIFSSALTTSDVIDFIIVLGDVLNIGTPSDNTVSLAKLTATGTKDATTFLRGDNTFAVPAGGVNTPAFQATLSANQTISHNTSTKIQFNSETFDTNSAYDPTTNYRFTVPSGQGGKYFIYTCIGLQGTNNREHEVTLYIRVNGTTIIQSIIGEDLTQSTVMPCILNTTVSLSATDYVEIFIFQYDYTANSTMNVLDTTRAVFGGYKLIGV